MMLEFRILCLSFCLFSLIDGMITKNDGYKSDLMLVNNRKLALVERIALEKATFHWMPYKKILVHKSKSSGQIEEECWDEAPRAIEEFPKDFFTHDQKLKGLFIVHVVIAVYFFTFLAVICDNYFLPSVERICQILDISQDVAASTFMATATTMPEFFANTISTFVAESDMGLSAIIGSMLFNTLGVAACASLFIKRPVQIDWWPITRDSILFSCNVSILVIIAWDGVVMWYEATTLVAIYFGYWILMFQNHRIVRAVKYIVEERLMWCQRIKADFNTANQRSGTQPTVAEDVKPKVEIVENFKKIDEEIIGDISISKNNLEACLFEDDTENDVKLWQWPVGKSPMQKFWFFYTWPIRFLLHFTIPDPIKYKNWFALSFFLCIVWIAIVSYVVFWMVVILGDTFGISDPIMGLTFLAFGGCMPEAISAVIVARRGSGQMGVSNALGANSLAVLFSLGFPWFIKTMMSGAWKTEARIRIFSHGIEFTILGLILAVLSLYVTVFCFSYQLRKEVGIILVIAYVFFATFAILVELDIFFDGSDRC